jgi:alditol oxidase
VERALAPFAARPHWAKLFLARAREIGPLYERLGDFRALLHRYDPRGAFRNDWLRARVLGDGAWAAGGSGQVRICRQLNSGA